MTLPAAARRLDPGPGLIALLTLLALLAFLLPARAAAQTMVSVDRPTVNMRAGAGTQHPVLWALAQGYPLQVVAREGEWLQVRDFEGDTGWVLARLTGREPHVVVKVPRANLRAGPATTQRIVGRATYGELWRTVDRRAGWVQVRHADGRSGWIARDLVWGW